MEGRVQAIYISAVAEAPMEGVESVEAVAGAGLAGDRYAAKVGTFSKNVASGRALTLIESEAIEAARRDYGLDAEAGDTRRNLVTTGVPLNHLVGREFTIGPARVLGIKLNEPCEHMERVSGRQGLRRALLHRGGLRADILEGGTIHVGDSVVAAPPA